MQQQNSLNVEFTDMKFQRKYTMLLNEQKTLKGNNKV